LRKRYYILLVARDGEGQLRKIPIPLHYLYVFLAGALIGMFTITGIAGSYTRMLTKVAQVNQLRHEKEALKTRYNQLERTVQEKELQVASLGSLASEVSSLYGLRSEVSHFLAHDQLTDEQVASSIDELYALRDTALSGAATIGIGFGELQNATTGDWLRLAAAPNIWPVAGSLTGSFGERNDPFNGEGAFHMGVDINASYGEPVVAPADGAVVFADFQGGYGRLVEIRHGQDYSTRFGHLSSIAVMRGQNVRRGDVIGYVGQSGRSTGPHLHYEVRIRNVPVNPYKYLRTTIARATYTQAAGD
jgi:murein DD-endopeptidase MepM/ murein hydrolase activator NlpD